MPPTDEILIRLAPHAEVLEPALAMAGAAKLPGRYDAREIARLCGISGSRRSDSDRLSRGEQGSQQANSS